MKVAVLIIYVLIYYFIILIYDVENGLNFIFFSFIIINLLQSLHRLAVARTKAKCSGGFGNKGTWGGIVPTKSVFLSPEYSEIFDCSCFKAIGSTSVLGPLLACYLTDLGTEPYQELLTLILKPRIALLCG